MLLMKLFYTALWIKQRATIGAQIAVIRNGRILLVRHTYKPGWHLPGGGVEPPEPPDVTVARELHEETGLRLPSPPRLIGIVPNVSRATKRDYIVAFHANDTNGSSQQPRGEIAEIVWFALDSLPSNTHPMVTRVIDRLK